MQAKGRLGLLCQNCSRLLNRLTSTAPDPTRVTADLEDQHHKKPKHFYTEYVPWNTRSQLSHHIHSQILFNDENYIALNKPPGLPMGVDKENPPIFNQTAHMSNIQVPENATLSMNETVMDISKKLNFQKNVRVCLPNQRLNSGIVIYSKNTTAHDFIMKWWRNTRTNKIFSIKYWALTLGIPDPLQSTSGEDVFYVRQNKDHSSIMKYESLRFASRDKRKDGKAIQSNMKHRVLAANTALNVALVEVQPTWSVHDMVPLYLTHRLSPVLGDHVYSHLVGRFSGQPMLVSSSISEETPQKLQPEIHRELSIKKSDNIYIPLHLHLAQAVIPVIGKKKTYHTINAPLPDIFIESLKRLGMEYTEESSSVSQDDLKQHNFYKQKDSGNDSKTS